MSSRTIDLTESLYDYLIAMGTRESEPARELRNATREATARAAGMQISPEQGAFMAVLVRLIGARRTIEIGTVTVSEEWTAIGRPYWERAGVAGKIDLRLAPGAETLAALVAAGEAGRFDFAFIDADKSGYDTYYEHCLTLLRPGGVIGVDNVLWGGRVADPGATDDDTRAIRALNAKVHADERVDACLLPIGDGLTLAVKR
jgi:predicted O-methyltransferase YrrM